MSGSFKRAFESNNVQQSILNHLFLPIHLPSSTERDYITANDYCDEHELLQCVREFFESCESQSSLSIFGVLQRCVDSWSRIQDVNSSSVSMFKSTIEQLKPGDFLSLYFARQNAAILIEIDEDKKKPPLISAWQVILPTSVISSSFEAHLSTFPVSTFRLATHGQLTSTIHCELLVDLMTSTIEYSKTIKSAQQFDEIRDTPISHYVSQWWIQQFQDIREENQSYSFKKKHRDQVRWNRSLLPFRRSGLWMTIKVVLQTILSKNLGQIGKIVYKIFITQFLTFCLFTRTQSMQIQISNDLMIHCIRKISRRLHKIERLTSSLGVDHFIPWIKQNTEKIIQHIRSLMPFAIWQRPPRTKGRSLAEIRSLLNQSDVHQHSLFKIKIHLAQDRRHSSTKKPANTITINHYDGVQIPSVSILTNQAKYSTTIALIRMEIWVENQLERWLINSLPKNNAPELLSFFQDYQRLALSHYESDPFGYSRYILTSLSIIRQMHQTLCNDSRFERLKYHQIQIPSLFELFEYLVLPNRDQMLRASALYIYFFQFSTKTFPDLLKQIDSPDAFGVNFAAQSSSMMETLGKIQAQEQRDSMNKVLEVNNARRKYEELMKQANQFECQCHVQDLPNTCHRCPIIRKSRKMVVSIYERSIPSKLESALAVIFELQMPTIIRCYREILWTFINRFNTEEKNNHLFQWLNIPPQNSRLRPFYVAPYQSQVKLVSSIKSISQSHYAAPRPIASTPLDGYVFECSLNVQLTPSKVISLEEECQKLTPQLTDANYQHLQYSLLNTTFVQNQVIADVSQCSLQLKASEFIEFGSFRSGHRLQWWNLLSILQLESLSFDEESVAILILHSIFQYGPIKTDHETRLQQWCSESHRIIFDDHFVDEFISLLDHRLNECGSNWQNTFRLTIITSVAMRIFTLCCSTRENQLLNLILKCRQIGEKWILLIEENLRNTSALTSEKSEILRDKIVIIGITCLLTFSVHSQRISFLLSADDHVISLLKATTSIHDNLIMNAKHSKLSAFAKNLQRYSEEILVLLQPVLGEYLQKTFYQSLSDFSAQYWKAIQTENFTNIKWKKRNQDTYDAWYDGHYDSTEISIDCLRGTFLVNGMTIGFLPESITSNALFQRVFGDHIFEVQPTESNDTYITKHGYHVNGDVYYAFRLVGSSDGLIVEERHFQTNKHYRLIPPSCFEFELPDLLVSNYSHWMNNQTQQIEFRPIHFQHANFLSEKHDYILMMNTGLIMTNNTDKTHFLINQLSTFFKALFQRYFYRLDDDPFVYMLKDDISSATESFVHIHLPRLGIAFKYDVIRNLITSREYSNMQIDENQSFGTLTGLASGLLLSSISYETSQQKQNYLPRKLIVPFGQVQAYRTGLDEHQTVTIEQKSSFVHHYFVFILNDRLKILQPTDSPTGWLYLALLHAMTSNPLPDQYTGMTGMERAFQSLNSAGCWSNQPYDPVSLDILVQIAKISPKANFYPEHLTSMIDIDWNNQGLPYSMQHFGYYLIAKKLLESSEQWNFIYPSSASEEIEKFFKNKKYNVKVLEKLYWDYRDTYNPLARLSDQMETEIKKRNLTKSYEPVSHLSSVGTIKSAVNLVDDLYSRGNVDLKDSSKLRCFPLSQWLSADFVLPNVYIGLLKSIEEIKVKDSTQQPLEIERFTLLLDFLRYICLNNSTYLSYLQLLKGILFSPNFPIGFIRYPSFDSYENINEISFVPSRISFPKKLKGKDRSTALQEVQECYYNHTMYSNKSFPTRGINKKSINDLLRLWRSNEELRRCVQNIHDHLKSIPPIPFRSRVPVQIQQFTRESFENHYLIRLRLTDYWTIDTNLLKIAQQKFHRRHSNYFPKSTSSVLIPNKEANFPDRIFPSTDANTNSLSDIAKHFQSHLQESWKQLQSTKEYHHEYPSLEEIRSILETIRLESAELWKELIKSITLSNELLFSTGLLLRMTPSTLVSILQQICLHEYNIHMKEFIPFLLTTDQRTLLGGMMVNWIVEQQLERALHLASQNKQEDFEKEMGNIPHTNWIPSEHVPWLILELEMNITIREIQVDVARHMIEPKINKDSVSIRNIVMQMNMGEGKTSVILPMLALSLCSSTLVRIIVLKSLFPMNYQSLRYKLGGLLNRRVVSFACRRDMNFDNTQVNQILDRLEQAFTDYDVILTSPEDILSFDLLTIEKCRRKEWEIGRSMLTVQRWLKASTRDILDESDEILHVKYQLIYSIGGQQQVDGGMERWKTIQSVLQLVQKHASTFSQEFNKDVFYKPSNHASRFCEFRLLSHRAFPTLSQRIAIDWLNEKNYRQSDQKTILSFLLETDSSIDNLIDRFPFNIIQLFLLMRGLLSAEVLFAALKRRYRVNFGVNRNPKFNRLIAVPFRAKDVAAENTEFGHPDVAIILTQLSYYYSGLDDVQMLRCFDRLDQVESDPDLIYDEWISQEDRSKIETSIHHWKGVNIKDYQQRTEHLFPTLRHNMLVINYFLNYFVFPREAKQFPYKLVSSAWDLSSSSRTHILTGFSGTNDTQLLLPVHIRQCDLPQLQKTDAIVLNNLLRTENENYQSLPVSANTREILTDIVHHRLMIHVILDVGALFIDGNNRQIAMTWLHLSNQERIDYAVYFESDEIFVCDRFQRHQPFLTSPASERLDRCVFYLDEIHTRGTDLKFPNHFRAAVTLGNGLTKDRLVQACMRMRKLGQHHWLSFWSSHEVHQQIQLIKKTNDPMTLVDILRWVYENTQAATWDGLHLWAAQSLSYQCKTTAFQPIHWTSHQQTFTHALMEKLAKDCLEKEVIELKSMYGPSKSLQKVWEIYLARYQHSSFCSSTAIHEAVLKRLRDYGGSKQLLAQLLDEEQQRELEQELEEEQQKERPSVVEPCKPIFHDAIKKLCNSQGPILDLVKCNSVFSRLSDAFHGTTFYSICQADCWGRNLWISTEFQRVIETRGETLDPFLRPPRWIVVYRYKHIILVSPMEANWLIGHLPSLQYQQISEDLPITTVRLLLPRLRRGQSILVNHPALTIPPSIRSDSKIDRFSIPIEWLVQLFLFNGTLYFENDDEQVAYCHCLGVCPKPRTKIEEHAFELNWITIDGFVEEFTCRRLLHMDQCRFKSNPLTLIRKLIETRNNTHAPLTSHVGSILLNGFKQCI